MLTVEQEVVKLYGSQVPLFGVLTVTHRGQIFTLIRRLKGLYINGHRQAD